jgi:nitrogenase molybdenum-iron protein NifN
VLPGCHLTPGDIEELKDIMAAFGLSAVVLPDVSGSLDGHIPPDWRGTTLGGASLENIKGMGRSVATLAIGEQMRAAGQALHERTGVPLHVFDRLTGLVCNDRLMSTLSEISAMLDAHFHIGKVKVAIGAEPDLLFAAASTLHEMGAELVSCVTTTHAKVLEQLPVEKVLIGDLEDLELAAKDADLLITHSHGRQAAERLNKPFMRLGFPIFDRIGNSHRLMVGYRGTRQFIFEVANMMLAHLPHADPNHWPLPEAASRVALPPTIPPSLSASATLPWPTSSQPSTQGVAP